MCGVTRAPEARAASPVKAPRTNPPNPHHSPQPLCHYLAAGNGFKVRLLLAHLGMKYQWTNLDIDQGLTRTPEFLRKNPNGRIPTLELDDGT